MNSVALQLTGAQAPVRALMAEQVPQVLGIVGGKLAFCCVRLRGRRGCASSVSGT